HLAVIHVELFGQDLQEAGRDPVTGLDLAHLQRDGVVGADAEPRVELRGVGEVPAWAWSRGGRIARERPDGRDAGDGSARALEEALARELLLMHEARHRYFPPFAITAAACLIAVRMRG